MLKFIGGTVIIIITISTFFYVTGYCDGNFNINLTDNGKAIISKVAESSKKAINSGIDSIQDSVIDVDKNISK